MFILSIVSRKTLSQVLFLYLAKTLILIHLLSSFNDFLFLAYAIPMFLIGFLFILIVQKIAQKKQTQNYSSNNLGNQLIGFMSSSFLIGLILMFLWEYRDALEESPYSILALDNSSQSFALLSSEVKLLLCCLYILTALIVLSVRGRKDNV